MDKNLTLMEILEKAKQGDEYSFQLLIEEFKPLIFHYSKLSFYNCEECKQYLEILFWKILSKIKVDEFKK